MTQADVAEAVAALDERGRPTGRHIALRTYARWERAEHLGYLRRLDDIAVALKTTAGDLLGGEDPLTARTTVETLAAKLDEVLTEVAQTRKDLAELQEYLEVPKRRPRRR